VRMLFSFVLAIVCVYAPDVVHVAHGHDDIGNVEVGLVRLRPRLKRRGREEGGREGGREEEGREGGGEGGRKGGGREEGRDGGKLHIYINKGGTTHTNTHTPSLPPSLLPTHQPGKHREPFHTSRMRAQCSCPQRPAWLSCPACA
jgi:hypothetical protein